MEFNHGKIQNTVVYGTKISPNQIFAAEILGFAVFADITRLARHPGRGRPVVGYFNMLAPVVELNGQAWFRLTVISRLSSDVIRDWIEEVALSLPSLLTLEKFHEALRFARTPTARPYKTFQGDLVREYLQLLYDYEQIPVDWTIVKSLAHEFASYFVRRPLIFS